jgi:tRNA dimethylallyltransferase
MDLRESLEKLSTEELGKKLLELNEAAYKLIDTKNPARLVRAIEKASQVTQIPQRFENAEEFVILGLTAERELLYQRADTWVDSIFNEKLFEEMKTLQERFPKSHRLTGLIYKSAVDYLSGVAVLDEVKQRAKFDTHAYIRRQQTWFKRNDTIKWLDTSDKNFDSKAISIVESELNG